MNDDTRFHIGTWGRKDPNPSIIDEFGRRGWTSGGGGPVCDPAEAGSGEYGDPVRQAVHHLDFYGFVKISSRPAFSNSPIETRRLSIDRYRCHDDAEFSEVGRSMSAHYENSPLGGRKVVGGIVKI